MSKFECIRRGTVRPGVVLYLYENPWPDSKVLMEIDESTDFVIDENESVSIFYKICTAIGVEGFCLRKFINLT